MHSRSFFFSSSPPMRNAGANADSEFARRPFKRRCVRVFAAGFARKHAPASARKISAVAEYFPSAFRIFLRPLLAPHLKDGKRAPSVFEFYFMRGIRTRLRRPGIAGCAPIPKKFRRTSRPEKFARHSGGGWREAQRGLPHGISAGRRFFGGPVSDQREKDTIRY